MMNLIELRAKYIGKRVRTERVLTELEYSLWENSNTDAWYPGYKFGGDGLVINFDQAAGEYWIECDEGTWVIDHQTNIILIEARE